MGFLRPPPCTKSSTENTNKTVTPLKIVIENSVKCKKNVSIAIFNVHYYIAYSLCIVYIGYIIMYFEFVESACNKNLC